MQISGNATAVAGLHQQWKAIYDAPEQQWLGAKGRRLSDKMARVEQELLAAPAVCLGDVIAKLEVSLTGERVDLAECAIADLKRMDATLGKAA